MNYLDWLFNVLAPDEITIQNLEDIVMFQRKARMSAESGVKPKKADRSPKIDVVTLGLVKSKPKLIRRPVRG
jgi:hypothetical protein